MSHLITARENIRNLKNRFGEFVTIYKFEVNQNNLEIKYNKKTKFYEIPKGYRSKIDAYLDLTNDYYDSFYVSTRGRRYRRTYRIEELAGAKVQVIKPSENFEQDGKYVIQIIDNYYAPDLKRPNKRYETQVLDTKTGELKPSGFRSTANWKGEMFVVPGWSLTPNIAYNTHPQSIRPFENNKRAKLIKFPYDGPYSKQHPYWDEKTEKYEFLPGHRALVHIDIKAPSIGYFKSFYKSDDIQDDTRTFGLKRLGGSRVQVIRKADNFDTTGEYVVQIINGSERYPSLIAKDASNPSKRFYLKGFIYDEINNNTVAILNAGQIKVADWRAEMFIVPGSSIYRGIKIDAKGNPVGEDKKISMDPNSDIKVDINRIGRNPRRCVPCQYTRKKRNSSEVITSEGIHPVYSFRCLRKGSIAAIRECGDAKFNAKYEGKCTIHRALFRTKRNGFWTIVDKPCFKLPPEAKDQRCYRAGGTGALKRCGKQAMTPEQLVRTRKIYSRAKWVRRQIKLGKYDNKPVYYNTHINRIRPDNVMVPIPNPGRKRANRRRINRPVQRHQTVIVPRGSRVQVYDTKSRTMIVNPNDNTSNTNTIFDTAATQGRMFRNNQKLDYSNMTLAQKERRLRQINRIMGPKQAEPMIPRPPSKSLFS